MDRREPDRITYEDLQNLKQILQVDKKIQITIVSGSMEPFIVTGGKYFVDHIEDLASLKRFDIIVFHHRDFLVCHCLWHVNSLKSFDGEKLYITRGIANLKEDLPVPESKILGVVREPKLSFLQKLRLALFNRF